MNYYVYITANKNYNVIYIGVTNNIERRIYEHKSGEIKGFTQKYNVHKLVYVEMYSNIDDAIKREKQLKGWSRSKKNILIETTNPDWNELMC